LSRPAFANLPPGAPIDGASDPAVSLRYQILGLFFKMTRGTIEDVVDPTIAVPKPIAGLSGLDDAACGAYASALAKVHVKMQIEQSLARPEDRSEYAFAAHLSAFEANAIGDLCASSGHP